MTPSVLFISLLVLFPVQALGGPDHFGTNPDSRVTLSSVACEDFAKRQVGIADRALEQSKYSQALKVLNSTLENCDKDFVREKIVEVLNEWYGAVRARGSIASLRQFIGVLSNQPISSAQQARFDRRIKSYARALIRQDFRRENFEEAYRTCRIFRSRVSEHFATEYYCGASAEEVAAESATINSYEWLLENWSDDQSLASWEDIASTLEKLYLLTGRFQNAYDLAREMAVRDPSPKAVLSSLTSARGNFLSPIMRTGLEFYGNQPSENAMSTVGSEMDRINFPDYVKAIYLLKENGKVQRGMYGTEANAPSDSLLEKSSGSVSLLEATGESNLAWLVSPLDSKFLVLEFGVGTTPDENVRLEEVYENIESDEQWNKLYELEFTETSPATGSAVGTLLHGASLADQDFDIYDAVFDDMPLLSYYCMQDQSGGIENSYNFNREKMKYGDDEWERTSNTPALYHHLIEYDGQEVREVVWPKFVDESWTGVVRVGLARR